MFSNQKLDRSTLAGTPVPGVLRTWVLRASGFASLIAIALVAGSSWAGQQPSTMDTNRPYLSPAANRLPDANDQMKMREQEAQKQDFDTANAERKKQISDDSAKLLTLAMALKAEVDKTNKDMLSLNVIRKADEIEKLARSVKEKMKVSIAGGTGN
jgi:hypothetical protein